jgi:integrase
MPRANLGYQLGFYKPKGYKDRQWVLFWYEMGRKRERASGIKDVGKTFEAEEFRSEFIAAQKRSDGPAIPVEMSVADALYRYGSEHAPTVTHPLRIGYAIKALLPFWADKMVSDVRGSTCREYQKSRVRRVKRGKSVMMVPVTPATVRRELSVLRAALEYCVREGVLAAAPGMWMPEPTPARDRWLTRSEAARLLNAARNEPKARLHLPTFILIGLYTGAREEAIRSLQWFRSTTGGWIDLERRIIDFNPIGRRRTKKRRTVIPIPPQLYLHLTQVRKRTLQYAVEVDGVHVKKLRTSYGTACRNAGLKDVVRHTLRHTACTWFMHRGVNVWDAAGWVGMSIETFTRKYAHHHPDYMKGALDSFRPKTKIPHAIPPATSANECT